MNISFTGLARSRPQLARLLWFCPGRRSAATLNMPMHARGRRETRHQDQVIGDPSAFNAPWQALADRCQPVLVMKRIPGVHNVPASARSRRSEARPGDHIFFFYKSNRAHNSMASTAHKPTYKFEFFIEKPYMDADGLTRIL